MPLCLTCDEIYTGPQHTCPPAWHVFIVEEDGEYDPLSEFPLNCTVRAYTAREAAEKRVDRWDAGSLAEDEGEIEVIVYDADMASPHRFDVGACMRPVYYATEKIAAAAA